MRSKCSSCVGKEGILLQETQNTLKLICRDNKIRSQCGFFNCCVFILFFFILSFPFSSLSCITSPFCPSPSTSLHLLHPPTLHSSFHGLHLLTNYISHPAIPKANSVFAFGLDGFLFTLYGNHMRYRTGERSARKFKDKTTVDL